MLPGSVCAQSASAASNCSVETSSEGCSTAIGCKWSEASCSSQACSQLDEAACTESAGCDFYPGTPHNAQNRVTDPANLLFAACANGFCSSTIPCTTANENGLSHANALTKWATDGDTNTASFFWPSSDLGRSYFTVLLPSPRAGVAQLFLKSELRHFRQPPREPQRAKSAR